MLRRVHEILSRKFPKWVFEERTGPLDWSILPLEMKREIVKHTDFKTRCCLRQCSSHDQKIVDSFKTNLPFVRIETDKNYVSVLICEGRTQILKVVLTKKKLKLRKKKKTIMRISDNIHGEHYEEFYKNHDFDVLLSSLIESISRLHITIDTLNLSLRYPHDPLTKFLDTHYRQVIGPPRNTKIICSGMEFLCCEVHFLPINETRIINDMETNWENGRMMLASKTYNVVPTGHFGDIGKTTFWKPSLLDINLGALISGILWRVAGEMNYYYIPGMDVPEAEYQEIVTRFEGRITWHFGIPVLHVSNGATPERKLMVKITKCGVVIQKARFEDVAEVPKDMCLLDWMCSKCDTSVESWYFRTITGVEEVKNN